MWRTNSSMSLGGKNKDKAAAAAAPADDDDEKLPPGWTKKESKSQKGRYYYMSPSGKTQWVPPVVKPPREYHWVSKVEITFQEARLGVSICEVKQVENIPFNEFQAEVDDLPKVNGKAGPAELYNWSVKPHQRLNIGMRVTSIDGKVLSGLTYKEVADRLRKTSARPLKICFADADKGTLDSASAAAQANSALGESGGPLATVPEVAPSAYLLQKQEYTRILVMSELHSEMWSIENRKISRNMSRLMLKWKTVSSEFNILNERRQELRNENERLTNDKVKYETMMKHLKLQESYQMENPELVKANALAKRNAELTEDIAKMGAGNKRLRKERVTLQTSVDELEKALAKLDKTEEEEAAFDDDIFGIDPNASPAEQLAALKKNKKYMDDELQKEQRKVSRVLKEMEQLNKHFSKMTGSSSSSSSSLSSSQTKKSKSDEKESSSSKRSSGTSSNGEKSSSSSSSSGLSKEIADLEAKILELRKKQRSAVEMLSKAANTGDKELAKDWQKKRHVIKEELKRAQDQLHALKTQGSRTSDQKTKSSSPSSSSSSSSTQKAPSSSKSSQSLHRSKTMTSSSSPMTELRNQKPTEKKKGVQTLSGFLEKGPTEWSEKNLIKNMKTMRGARERWCELTPDGFLKYFKRRGDTEVRGQFDLSDKSLEVVCEDMKRGREFILCTNVQQSHFYAETPQELASWVKALRAANQYLVMNKQLEKMAGKSGSSSSSSSKSSRRNGYTPMGAHAAAIAAVPEEDEQFYGRATLGF